MSITGKITNLFVDKAMTIPAFPRTKIKAVSDDNGVGLDAILNGMVHAEEYGGEVATVPLNADTLEGKTAADFASASVEESVVSLQRSIGSLKLEVKTSSEYEALSSKDSDTLYIIVD